MGAGLWAPLVQPSSRGPQETRDAVLPLSLFSVSLCPAPPVTQHREVPRLARLHTAWSSGPSAGADVAAEGAGAERCPASQRWLRQGGARASGACRCPDCCWLPFGCEWPGPGSIWSF